MRLRTMWLWANRMDRDSEDFELITDSLLRLFVWGVGLAGFGYAGYLSVAADFGAGFWTAALAGGWLWFIARAREVASMGSRQIIFPGRPPRRIRFGDLTAVHPVGEDGLSLEFEAHGFGPKSAADRRHSARFANRDAFVEALFRRVEQSEGKVFAESLRSRSHL